MYQLVKCTSALDMWAMSTASKYLQAALVGAFGLLGVSDGNHRIGISPDDQYRDVQPCQSVAQIHALLSITESGMGGCHQRLVCAGLHALLVELVYQCLLKQASLDEEMCEFGAQVLLRWLGAHQIEHCAINFRSQSGAIDQSLYALRIASGKGKSYCTS